MHFLSIKAVPESVEQLIQVKSSICVSGKLQKAEEELHLHVTEVSQLKAYIGENLPDSQLERLKQENTDLRSDSKALRHENTSLKTTVDLLNIRLSSISEILTIQDAELKKSLKSPASDIQEDNLVTLWRQKVFALLVQLKSQEISQEHEKNLERTQVNCHFVFFLSFCSEVETN